ncbi:MAG: glycoside hydrolase family 127 protein [Lachnospiraceae bacterium]|nr:glycoside hydrolase family 127 protein [Lachnospiraceae bacterium]
MITPKYTLYPLNSVRFTDPYLENAFEKEVRYLSSLDPERLLAGFYETAGIKKEGLERYGGWENLLIGGHTLGHYLAACVYAYESANSVSFQKYKLISIIKAIVNGLKTCQDALGTGFIFGAVIQDKDNIELQFDMVEQGKTDIFKESWVPWYTMHKIYEGLLAVAKMPDNPALSETALEVLSSLSDWCYKRTSSWDDKTHRQVLDIEYGGMNDVLFDTYTFTKKEEHLKAARSFVDKQLYDNMINAKPGDNALNNIHANTTIPKFVGALTGYFVTGDTYLLDAGKAFWKLVTELHTYITGGNSEWEHFGLDSILNAERTNCNCETCNVYNMLKLTMLLFKATEEKKYLDWYENAFINQILSSQNPETGMTTYFQAMATGYFKTYGNPTDKFWCCTGTGMENFSKLGESFFIRSDDGVIINQYFSSVLYGEGFTLTIESTIPEGNTVTISVTGECEKNIYLRKPDWLAGEMKFESSCIITQNDDYAVIEGPIFDGMVIVAELPMKINAYNLPDGQNTYGFKYGPVVLSAKLGSDNMETAMTGVAVTIPKEKMIPVSMISTGTEVINICADPDNPEAKPESVETFMKNIDKHMVRNDTDELSFTLKDTDANLTYVTHYKQHKERYGLYFEFCN